MITSGFGLQSMMLPADDDPQITITGTPEDNFPDEQRAQFCGSSDAKSTTYVREFSIPTLCTNPLAVVTDYDGNVWFAETNTGKLAKFDPVSETFTEYDNPLWPIGGRSMALSTIGLVAAPARSRPRCAVHERQPSRSSLLGPAMVSTWVQASRSRS